MTKLKSYDVDLSRFEVGGAVPMPDTKDQGYIDNDGARIWYSAYVSSSSVILLHGGLGHIGNWGHQVPALVAKGYRAVVVDTRGHSRNTGDARPYTYELMAADVLAVMDSLRLDKVALVGWSDGACTALVLASKVPSRVSGVFFFGCNIDPSGAKEIKESPQFISRCFSRYLQDYKKLSATPDQFDEFVNAVVMKIKPLNYSVDDLAQIRVPVRIVHSEHDEFIKREQAEYLARCIPNRN